MSFILDALKKSESDRQRQSGPALFEVKVAPPRTRLPLWAVAIGLLLAVNLVIVAWMLLRRPAAHAETALAQPLAAPVATALPPPVTAPAAAAPVPATAVAAPALAATTGSAPASAAPLPGAAPAMPTAAQGSAAADTPSAEDLAPAADAPAAPATLSTHVRRGTADGVPLYQDWAATPGTQVPQLRLDLHVYAARPEERFAMINMKKVHEGDLLPGGVRVESITPEGAVLSYNGSRFLLPRD
jgi:general secretion pathway protein B